MDFTYTKRETLINQTAVIRHHLGSLRHRTRPDTYVRSDLQSVWRSLRQIELALRANTMGHQEPAYQMPDKYQLRLARVQQLFGRCRPILDLVMAWRRYDDAPDLIRTARELAQQHGVEMPPCTPLDFTRRKAAIETRMLDLIATLLDDRAPWTHRF